MGSQGATDRVSQPSKSSNGKSHLSILVGATWRLVQETEEIAMDLRSLHFRLVTFREMVASGWTWKQRWWVRSMVN